MTGARRPVPRASLPEGVTCAVARGGRVTDADREILERFQQFLADDKAAASGAERQRNLREYLGDAGLLDDDEGAAQ